MATGSADKRWSGRRLQRLRARILGDEPLCRRCVEHGHVRLAEVLDHIQPLSKGGTYDDANLRPLCRECHRIVSGGAIGCDVNGYPLGPHWWKRK